MMENDNMKAACGDTITAHLMDEDENERYKKAFIDAYECISKGKQVGADILVNGDWAVKIFKNADELLKRSDS